MSSAYAEARALRRRARGLERAAMEIESREIARKALFIVVEEIQDGRPMASGPYAWAKANKIAGRGPNRTVCDYGGPLP